MINYNTIAKSILENVNTASADKVYLIDGTEIVVADHIELNTAFRTEEVRESRSTEYPSIGDQLDALFHAGVFPEEMAAQIQAVKDAHPKPTTEGA
jgi:hypothetical protein